MKRKEYKGLFEDLNRCMKLKKNDHKKNKNPTIMEVENEKDQDDSDVEHPDEN